MRDPDTRNTPGGSGEGSDAPRPEELALERAPGAEGGNAPERPAPDMGALAKRALAGAALAGLTELALGRRIYFAWEALRHAVTWLNKPAPGAQPATEQQPATRRPRELPTPQQAVEGAIEDVLGAGKRALERNRPMIDRARKRAVQRLKEPHVAAAVIAGATLGVVSAIGVLPTVLGAGTAYMVHRKSARERQRDQERGLDRGGAAPAGARA